MSDPLPSSLERRLSQMALAAKIGAASTGKPQAGVVVSLSDAGQALISSQGKTYSVNLSRSDLHVGQSVWIRSVGDRMEIAASPKERPNSVPLATPRTITQLLADLGIPENRAVGIAQALLKAGIPLEAAVLKELVQQFPNFSEAGIAALVFLLQRGLPLSESILLWIRSLFTPRLKWNESWEKLLSALESLEKSSENTEEFPEVRLDQLRAHREILEQLLSVFTNPERKEELARFIRSFLTTPDAQIQNTGTENSPALGESLVQLLSFLLEIYPKLTDSQLKESVASLIQQVERLHEALSGQALQNLSSTNPEASPVIFFQIPFRDGDLTQNLEVLYQAKDREKKSGVLNLRLELSRLGPMQVSLRWEPPRLAIRFWVETAVIGSFLETGMEQLKQALMAVGIQTESVGFRVGKVPESIRPEEASSDLPEYSGLDVLA